jgi:hypothetical protein
VRARCIQPRFRILPALALVVLACLGVIAVPIATAAKLEKTLPLNPAQLDDARLAAALDLARRAGVKQIQTSATWWWLTRWGERAYDWSDIDRLVAAAEARQMDVVLQVHGTPDWVHPHLPSAVRDISERVWYPPVGTAGELHHWSQFVRDLVTRYRGRVDQYEIWNEENTPDFWKPEPRVDDFAQLMRTAYYAVRETDPSAEVVLGGLSFNDIGYLNAYYDTVDAQWPQEARAQGYFFDVLGAHPYSAERSPRVNHRHFTHVGRYGTIDRNFIGFRRLKGIVDARDARPKPVYIGEYGFSTRNTWMPAVPDRVRARFLRHAYNLAASRGWVTGMAWYGFVPNTATGPEWTIVDSNLNPSRTYKALRKVPSGPAPRLIDPFQKSG